MDALTGISDNSIIAIGATALIRLDQLTNSSTGLYVSNATVNFALANTTNTIYNANMAYINSSNGRYEGTIPASNTTNLVPNTIYILNITASDGVSVLYHQVRVPAMYDS